MGRWCRVIAGVGSAVALLLLAGCGSLAPSSASSSASSSGGSESQAEGSSVIRPDPCSLLTPKQLDLLALNHGERQQGDGGVSCSWTNYPASQGSTYTARLLTGSAPGSTSAAPPVAGYPTQQVSTEGLNNATSCGYLLDVGSGRHLWVQYTNSGQTRGLNHHIACQKTQAAAAVMATTYRSLPH
jgi:hypothetical protein